jgi:hypothetical protein
MVKTLCLGVSVMLGVAAEANVYACLAGRLVFRGAGVTTTGPFNQHFVRDIGLIFLFLGTAFLLGAARPRFRLVLWAAPTLWLYATRCSISGKLLSASAGHRCWHAISPPSRCPRSLASHHTLGDRR